MQGIVLEREKMKISLSIIIIRQITEFVLTLQSLLICPSKLLSDALWT